MGPALARVAQLTVTDLRGVRRLGSGYLLADGVVLTAGHVLDGAAEVVVTFRPDRDVQRRVQAVSWWADAGTDLGLVSIAPGIAVEPALFGRLPARADVVAVHAVGFPRWKMRNADGTVPVEGDGKRRFRESAHIVGSSPLQSNSRRRTLEVVLPAAPAESADGHSPWEGMSGAALWVGELIVGVVAQHHPAEGLARLAAVRVDVAVDDLAPGRVAELGLPASALQLPDALGVVDTPGRAPVPWMAPALPGATTARPDLLTALLTAVTADSDEVVSIEGPGGFGKTTLAAMALRDPRVAQRFTGGLLWVGVGERSTGARLAELIGGLCETVSGERPRTADPQVAGGRLGELLSEREPVLLVIDDVWRPEQLAPFLIGGWSCRRLVTTRNAGVAPHGAVSMFVDEMTYDQAVTTLTAGVPEQPAELLGRLLDATGRWPLLLSLVNAAFTEQLAAGGQVAEVATWILRQLETAGPSVFDVDLGGEGDRSRAVEATLEMSLALLGPEGIERYLDLAVTPAGAELPADLLARFWDTAERTVRGAEKLRARLVRLRLVQPGWSEGTPTVRLHDVVRAYLRHRMRAAELETRHRRMVETAGEPWWEMPEPHAYLWHNLPYHLVHAGRVTDRDALVGDLRWVAAKTNALGTSVPVEVDLADVPAEPAQILRRALASITWLLAPSDPVSALGATIHAYLSGVPELSGAVAAYGRQLRGPHLVPEWPLPDQPRRGLVRTLTGHTNGVSHCAYSADGSLLATAGNDHTARVWDAATGTTLRVFTGHDGPVSTCDISADGTLLATGGHDRSVRLWDIGDGTRRALLTAHSDRVTACLFSPDGTRLVTTGRDRVAIVWDVRTGTPVRHLLHPSAVLACDFSPEGAAVATVCEDGGCRVWDLRTGTERTLFGGSAAVLSCAFSPDGKFLATAGADQDVTLWDVATGTRARVLTGHTDTVASCAFSPDGTLVASAGHDLTTRIWDVAAARARATLSNSQSVTSCAFSPDGGLLAVADHDWEVMIWQADVVTSHDEHHLQWEYACAFSPDGSTVATAGYDRAVRIWQVSTGELVRTLPGHTGIVGGVAFSADGRLLATAGHDRTVRVWDTTTGASRVLEGHTDAVVDVAFAPDGRRVASASHDDTVRIWDAVSGEPLATMTGHTGAVAACAFSPEGTLVASSGHDHTVRLWDAANGDQVRVLTGHTDLVSGCAFSPDGSFVASASHDRTCRIWDVASGAERQVLTRYGTGVADCVFAPDGSLVSTDIHDCRVTLWHVGDAEPVAGLRVLTPLLRLAWHPHEALLCAVGESGVYLFRLVAGD